MFSISIFIYFKLFGTVCNADVELRVWLVELRVWCVELRVWCVELRVWCVGFENNLLQSNVNSCVCAHALPIKYSYNFVSQMLTYLKKTRCCNMHFTVT